MPLLVDDFFFLRLLLHRRMRKFTSLKKMVVWYMGGEKARRRKSDFWKLTLRGAEASSEEERGAGRGGGVWIPPPPEEQRGVHEELNERVMGKITFTDDGAGGVQMDTSGMSPMRMSGGGVGNGGGELLRLKGGMKLFTHNILSSPVHGAEVKKSQAPQLQLTSVHIDSGKHPFRSHWHDTIDSRKAKHPSSN
jgi:hypothetical protein